MKRPSNASCLASEGRFQVGLRGQDLNLRPSGYEADAGQCVPYATSDDLRRLPISESVTVGHSLGTVKDSSSRSKYYRSSRVRNDVQVPSKRRGRIRHRAADEFVRFVSFTTSDSVEQIDDPVRPMRENYSNGPVRLTFAGPEYPPR